jgi:serine/threonine protein kinase
MTEPTPNEPTPVEIDVKELGPLRKIGSGGQGTVYELVDDPQFVYKEYSPRVIDDVDVAALTKFVRFARDLGTQLAFELTSRAAWPIQIVRRDGVVQGFLMRRAPEDFSVEMAWANSSSTVLGQVQFLLNSEDYLDDRGLQVDDRFRLQFLQDTAQTLALFHQLGITVGDLSPNNLLFTQTTPPQCFFIDCDAMRLGEDTVLEQVETPEWQVTQLGEEELATPASDSHKFGLLTIRLFAGDQHSRDPKVVPQRLRQLVVRSLETDPAKRPAADEWTRPISTILQPRTKRRRRTKPPAPTSEWLRPLPITPAAPRGLRVIRRFGIGAAAISLFVFLVSLDSNTKPAANQTPSTPFLQSSDAPTGRTPDIRITPAIIPPSVLRGIQNPPTIDFICAIKRTGYASSVAANDKVDGALSLFLCAVDKKDAARIPGPKDATFQQRFDQAVAADPGFLTITGITKGTGGTLKVTSRFKSGDNCQRTTFTLSPHEDGYEVSGLTALVKTTGCG